MKEYELKSTTKITVSEDGTRTYSYSKKLEDISGVEGIFILLYPTRDITNYHVVDSTSMHLMNHMNDLGLNSFTIVNLFSTVTKSRLSTCGLSIDQENLAYIKEEIFSKVSKDTKVIVAWGNSHMTSAAVNHSKELILSLYEEVCPGQKLYQLTCSGLEKDNMGVHPLYLGIRHKNATWNLSVYPHQKVLKELAKNNSSTANPSEQKRTKSKKSKSQTEE